jgi:polygalacturonase
MHRAIRLQHLLLLLALFSGSALASPPDTRSTSFNVKEFGAQGDGRADDTKALQAAFDAAANKTWSEQPPGSAYFISIATVFIPAGKYLITETIDLKANVLGE